MLLHRSSTSSSSIRSNSSSGLPPQQQQQRFALARYSSKVYSSSRRIAPSEERQQQQGGPNDVAAAARRASVKLPQLLTRQVAAATSLSQLQDIIECHGTRINHIHVAKLLTRTSQLSASTQDPHQSQQQQLDHLHSTLTELAAQRARHMTPQTLVASVAAIGRLQNTLAAAAEGASNSSSTAAGASTSAASTKQQQDKQPQQQLQQLAARAADIHAELTISQLSALLWGFAKARLNPTRAWLDVMLDAVLQQYETTATPHHSQQQQEQQQELQQAQQQVQPSQLPEALQLLQRPSLPMGRQQQQQQAVSLPHTRRQQSPLPHQHSLATDLALVIYAAAVMGVQPQQQWLVAWQAAVLQQLPQANAQDLSQMLWGLAALRQNPGGQQWLEQVLLAFADQLSGCGSQALANSIWAVQRLTQQQQQVKQVAVVLPSVWLQAYLEEMYSQAELAANPQALSCCLACLARLRVQLDFTRVAGLLQRSADNMAGFTPRQLTDTLWACASLNVQPSPAWFKSFLQAAARAADAGRFTVQQLSTLVWSLAVAKPPSQALLMSQQLQVQVLLQAMSAGEQGQGLRVLGPVGRSGLAWALASLGVVPDKAWLSQFLATAFADGLAGDKLRCASTLFCLASLDFDSLVEWLGDFLEGKYTAAAAKDASQSGGLDLSLQKYAALVGVLGSLAEMDPKQLRAAWLDQTLPQDWAADAANEVVLGSSMHLPPALAYWVDSLTEQPAAT